MMNNASDMIFVKVVLIFILVLLILNRISGG